MRKDENFNAFVRVFAIVLIMILVGGCISTQKQENNLEVKTSIDVGTKIASARNAYYVSSAGLDENNGSKDKPWKTINYGLSKISAGSQLVIEQGTYNEALELTNSGTKENPIVIIGNGKVVIDGTNTGGDGLILRPGISNVEINNIKMTNLKNNWALSLYGGNDNIRIENVEIEKADTGIHLTVGESGKKPQFGSVTNLVMNNLYIHDNAVGGIDCTPGPCIGLTLTNSLLEKNGISSEGNFGADGFAVEVGDNILLDNVTSRNNGGDGVDIGSRTPIFSQKSADVSVANSEIYRNGLNGLKLWNGGKVVNTLVKSNGIAGLALIYNARYEVVNSLIAGNGIEGRDYGSIIGYDEPVALGKNDNLQVYFFNNIVYKNSPGTDQTGIYLGKGVSFYSDYNIWFSRDDEEIFEEKTQRSYANGERLGNNDKNSIYTDPNLDSSFIPKQNSNVLDAGTNSFNGINAPGKDIKGNMRNKVDIGPYEIN
ncbi:MAG: hypothetical protein AABX38_07840 [Candidatus Micrarchaeota archaeon]